MTDQLAMVSTQHTLASRYKRPIVKDLVLLLTNAGIQAVPYVGSPLAALIFGSITLAKERRTQVYLDELEEKLHDLGEDAVSREEFTHLFTVTARSAFNTQQDAKIRRFAQLFASFSNGSNFDRVDEYEEAAQLITELSEREFQIMLILQRYEAHRRYLFGQGSFKRLEELKNALGTVGNPLVGQLSRTGTNPVCASSLLLRGAPWLPQEKEYGTST